jgi:uncharacterized membrane protein YbhN (UPF0104 family)
MRPSAHAQATRRSASIDRPPVRRAGLTPTVRRIHRLRRSRLARSAAAALGSLAFAGLIVLALSGIGFAGIGRSLSNVHPWWLVAALVLNGLSMFLRVVSWQAALRAALPDVRL